MSDKDFDASKYLTNLGGRDYLEVKWRLLWLRTAHPEAIIATELVRLEGDMALFRAKVSIPGSGEATGWGSETAADFEDYIEKAETKALGRALAALGYGTQFCEDFDFHREAAPKVVDAPVERPRRRRPAPATDAQVRAIYAIARTDLGLSEEALNERARRDYARLPAELTREEASNLIDRLRAEAKAT